MTVIVDEWVTLSEAADIFSIGSVTELAQELSLSVRAVLISETVFEKGCCGDRSISTIIGNVLSTGMVPVRRVSGLDYYYTQVGATLPYIVNYHNCVFPVSHVLREALEPWLAERAVKLIEQDSSQKSKKGGTP